jgi:uncharacterized membrane protein (UPF0127 family)
MFGRPRPLYRATNADTGALIADHLDLADTHWTRMRGLLGTTNLEPGHGLWIRPCRQVHMVGMRYAIDLVFLDEQLRTVRTILNLAPNRFSPKVSEATSVLELPVSTLERCQVQVGTVIHLESIPR